MSNNPKFIVSHLDQQSGPFEEKELLAKWAKGELLPIDYVYDEGQQDWVLLSERFTWAVAKSQVQPFPAPPPLSEDTIFKRRRPVEASKPTGAPTPAVSAETKTEDVTNPSIRIGSDLTNPSIQLPHDEMTERTEVAFDLSAHTATTGITQIPGPREKRKSSPYGSAAVQLQGGTGEIDISSLNPGTVELLIEDASTKLTLNEPFKIDVKPADPVELVWTVADHQTVGLDSDVVIRALDDKGQVCLGHEDSYQLQVRGPVSQDVTVQMVDGEATVKFNHTRAEKWTMSIHNPTARRLRLPETHTFEWQPGEAARLVLDGPREFVAGNPLKVQVKAVDRFGNLAKTFNGKVVLGVKAS